MFASRAVAYVRQMLPWTLPLKLALGAILGALGGAGFLGYLSEYATYSYAIYFGIRPPLEGIPYLKAAVALGSLFLLLTGATVFLISTLLVRLLLWFGESLFRAAASVATQMLRRMPRPEQYGRLDFVHVSLRLAARPAWQLFLIATAIGLLAGGIAFAEFTLLDRISAGAAFPVVPSSVAFGLFAFVVTLTMTKPAASWWLAIFATAVYFAAWIAILFSPSQYSGFLRLVGYGGGLPVRIEMRDVAATAPEPGAEYFLMLRTTEALILMSSGENQFVEIPRDQVRRITHGGGGLRALPYRLPKSR